MSLDAYPNQILLSEVVLDRDNRQRKEITQQGVEELAYSIAERGLMNPVIIQRGTNMLIAGERRFTAYNYLRTKHPEDERWASIPYRYFDSLDPVAVQLIELEENLYRQDLSWQDLAVAVHGIHELRKTKDPEATAEATADAIGFSAGTVSKYLQVAREILKKNQDIITSQNMNEALRKIRRVSDRGISDTMSKIMAGGFAAPARVGLVENKPVITGLDAILPAPPLPQLPNEPILCADFHEWAAAYTGEPFNFIHCDFPYGIKHQRSAQGNVARYGAYNDDEDVYWDLLATLHEHKRKLIYNSSHIIFWFSMTHYAKTTAFFKEFFPEFVFEPFPLIWHKDRSMVPDSERRPRRVYEAALFGFSANRRTAKLRGNLVQAGGGANKIHASEKPVAMLRKFFEMVIDKNTRMLDPTCGSGSSVRAAKSLGAETAIGLEKNSEFAEAALKAYRSAEVLNFMVDTQLEKFEDEQ
jgi:DNA modification methylase